MLPGGNISVLNYFQPMTAKALMSSHKPIRIYMGALILDVINTGRVRFCFCCNGWYKELMQLMQMYHNTQLHHVFKQH